MKSRQTSYLFFNNDLPSDISTLHKRSSCSDQCRVQFVSFYLLIFSFHFSSLDLFAPFSYVFLCTTVQNTSTFVSSYWQEASMETDKFSPSRENYTLVLWLLVFSPCTKEHEQMYHSEICFMEKIALHRTFRLAL